MEKFIESYRRFKFVSKGQRVGRYSFCWNKRPKMYHILNIAGIGAYAKYIEIII